MDIRTILYIASMAMNAFFAYLLFLKPTSIKYQNAREGELLYAITRTCIPERLLEIYLEYKKLKDPNWHNFICRTKEQIEYGMSHIWTEYRGQLTYPDYEIIFLSKIEEEHVRQTLSTIILSDVSNWSFAKKQSLVIDLNKASEAKK